MKILILATSNPSKHSTEAIEERGHTWRHYKPEDLYLFTSDNENGYDKVFYGPKDAVSAKQILLKKFDAIITRIGGDLQFSCNVLKHLNENLKLYSPQTSVGLLNATDKLRTIQLCSQEGLKVPKTFYAKNPTHVDFLIHKIGGLPAVAKTVRGSQGNGVFILKDVEQTNTSLQAVYNLKVDLILQEYIESEKTDIRAIVVGNKVVVAMERKGSKDFRANLSQKGGSGKKIELSEADQLLCVNAAKAVGLEFAGVDIIKHYLTGKSYVIEVNGNPGTKSIEITGVNWFRDLVIHIENQVDGRVLTDLEKMNPGNDLAGGGKRENSIPVNASKTEVAVSEVATMRRYFGL
jgi:ribosomal protein S6--L-glutamate ligase